MISVVMGCDVHKDSINLVLKQPYKSEPLLVVYKVITCSCIHIYIPWYKTFVETRSAVVEVCHPWSNVTVKRKLQPLKYYYDFEMSEHCLTNFNLGWGGGGGQGEASPPPQKKIIETIILNTVAINE